MAHSTKWESWPARDRRHSYRARVAPPIKAELFTVSAHIPVDFVEVSESGCLIAWNLQEFGPLVDETCELVLHFAGSKQRFPRVTATVRHRERRGEVFCAGLELCLKPKIGFAGLARELRRVWVEAQRRELLAKRG